jgi:hypothetical protein
LISWSHVSSPRPVDHARPDAQPPLSRPIGLLPLGRVQPQHHDECRSSARRHAGAAARQADGLHQMRPGRRRRPAGLQPAHEPLCQVAAYAAQSFKSALHAHAGMAPGLPCSTTNRLSVDTHRYGLAGAPCRCSLPDDLGRPRGRERLCQRVVPADANYTRTISAPALGRLPSLL